MRLQVDLNGILLQLNIHDYQPSTDDAWFCEWCRTDFSFSSKSWLNYHKEDDEILLSHEVETLAQMIDDLLSDNLTQPATMNCVEPDFTFTAYPQRYLQSDTENGLICAKPILEDVHMEWRIRFWEPDGLTDNYLSVTLYRTHLQILLAYLNCVIGKLFIDNPNIQYLIQNRYLID